jgi:hypothetical protein
MGRVAESRQKQEGKSVYRYAAGAERAQRFRAAARPKAAGASGFLSPEHAGSARRVIANTLRRAHLERSQ